MWNRTETTAASAHYLDNGATTPALASAATREAATAPGVADELMHRPEGVLGGLQQLTTRRGTAASIDGVMNSSAGQQIWPVATNVEATPEALENLFNRFAHETPQKSIAVISGGSLSGYATALELADQG